MTKVQVTNTAQRIECTGCGKFFASNTAFDFHRIGQFKKRTRDCMTSEELQAAGYATERKNVNVPQNGQPHFEERDIWYDIAGREKVRAWRERAQEESEE